MDLAEINRKFYTKLTETIESNPRNKAAHKNNYLTVIHQLLLQLIEKEDYQEIVKIFETSMKYFPSDSDVLNILGAALNK